MQMYYFTSNDFTHYYFRYMYNDDVCSMTTLSYFEFPTTPIIMRPARNTAQISRRV